MKILSVVGARPQFIKAATVSRILRVRHKEILVHTGQHYDTNMSEVFFQEMGIPTPDYNLQVGSGSHAEQTAAIMVGIEKVIIKEKPDYVLVYGDTNSTLGAALSASKQRFPIIHVEAGLRSFNKNMPEEQNRILTDHISTLLFCPTENAKRMLEKEGITANTYVVGDVMYDALKFYLQKLQKVPADTIWNKVKGIYDNPYKLDRYYLSTIHRAENTDDVQKIKKILIALNELDEIVLFPVHPRTKNIITTLRLMHTFKNIQFIEPLGYLEMLFFTANAKKVVTDSGGLQKEAYMLAKPCVTIRLQTEWPETLTGNYNILSSPDSKEILEKVLQSKVDENSRQNFFGNGHAADKIVQIIENHKGY